jgi:predicted transport protein
MEWSMNKDSSIIEKSFIDQNEFNFFRNISSQQYKGEGIIVDGGSFLGASTLAICQSLEDSGNKIREHAVIAIDRFVALDIYLVEFFASKGIDVRLGESFLDLFLSNVIEHINKIEVRCGDVTQVGRINGDIEICIVDIAKSPGINSYIIANWLTKMLPGGSLLIHQDFYAPSHPWIAVSMAELIEYFDIVEEKVGEGACFKLTQPIPSERVKSAMSIRPNSPAAERCFDIIIERLKPINSAPIRLMKAMLYYRIEQQEKAERLIFSLLEEENLIDSKWEQWMAIAVSAIIPKIFTSTQFLSRIYAERAAVRIHG